MLLIIIFRRHSAAVGPLLIRKKVIVFISPVIVKNACLINNKWLMLELVLVLLHSL